MTKRKEGAVKGRPVKYHDELIQQIADKIAEGSPLAQAIKELGISSPRRFYEVMNERPHFRTVLSQAREAQIESLVNMMWQEALTADETKIRGSQLRVQTIQWLLTRYAPKQFSERVLAEMAKLPEVKAEAPPPVDYDYLTVEERETMMHLLQIAQQRKEGTLIEGEVEETEEVEIEVEEVEGEEGDEPATEQSAGDDPAGDSPVGQGRAADGA
jgi:hypothetical protein